MTHEVYFKAIERPWCLLWVHTSTHFSEMISKPSQHLFSIIYLAEGHRKSHKYEFVKWIPRTNEATWLTIFSPKSAQKNTSFRARCLFGPGRTRTISPKLVPTPLILFGINPPCTTGTIQYMEDSNLARFLLPSGFSMSRWKNWELSIFFEGREDQNHAWCWGKIINRSFETNIL
jgi:hypothetical protein